MRLAKRFLLVVVLLPAPALAQDEVARIRAQKSFDAAGELFQAGQYQAAIEELQQADKHIPLPIYTFNIARCYEEMRRYDEALEHFERYLRMSGEKAEADRAEAAVAKLVARLFGSVEVGCEPGGATVAVEGLPEAACPFRRERVRPGKYDLAVRLAKYAPHEGKLKVVAGAVAKVAVKLAPLPGRLVVSAPAPGGEVWVDGDRVGKAPAGPLRLTPGPHTVLVKTPGYDDWTLQAVIPPDEDVAVMAAALAHSGTLAVRSKPAAAAVLLDGGEVGVTPLEGQVVPAGEHEVVLRLAGYADGEARVQVKKGARTVVKLKLDPIAGVLDVSSTPPGAQVLLDGQAAGGPTPVRLPSVPPGKHRVAARLAGHRSWEQVIRVKAGRGYRLEAELEELRGGLRVTSAPPGAKVTVDGKAAGVTPLALEGVTAGRRRVTLALAGHRRWEGGGEGLGGAGGGGSRLAGAVARCPGREVQPAGCHGDAGRAGGRADPAAGPGAGGGRPHAAAGAGRPPPRGAGGGAAGG